MNTRFQIKCPSSFLALLAVLSLSPLAEAAQKTLIFCSEGSPSTFSPALATDGTSITASARQIFDRLLDFKQGQTEVVPGLAESYSVSKDHTQYTFKLRKNVKWHSSQLFKPTRNFNADDVIFSLDRQRLTDHPFHKTGGGTFEYFDSMELGTIIKDVKKLDDYTVVITLSRPEAPFLSDIAMDFASIYSKEYADQLLKAGTPEKIDTDPIGTGPFELVKYVKDNQIRYKAFEGYYRGRAKIDQLIFAITPDASVRYQKLKAGECHLVTEPAPADLAAMKADPQFNVIERPGMNVAYLAFNTKKAPFNNREVRQALSHAFNKQSYIESIYLNNAEIAKNPMPPTIWSYNDKIKDYDYNPEKAKTLLTKAGFDFSKEYQLWTMPVSRPYNPNGKKMGELMQSDLAKIGVKIKLVTFDWPTYLTKAKQPDEFSMIQFGWTGDNGDPDNFLNILLSCKAVEAHSNTSFWCDKTFDDLVQKARTVESVKSRTPLYEKAQEIFKKEAPWLTIAHSKIFRTLSKKVQGYVLDPLGGDEFYHVDLSP